MENENQYIKDLKTEMDQAIAFGDFKAAYKLSDQIDALKVQCVKNKLGQMSVAQAHAAFPDSILVRPTSSYSQPRLEIDGDDYSPNFHDSGRITGWYKS